VCVCVCMGNGVQTLTISVKMARVRLPHTSDTLFVPQHNKLCDSASTERAHAL
jgi:hypothetical protein